MLLNKIKFVFYLLGDFGPTLFSVKTGESQGEPGAKG